MHIKEYLLKIEKNFSYASLLSRTACQLCAIVLLLTEGYHVRNAIVGGGIEAHSDVINCPMHCILVRF
ncbi:hypothetical protein T08_2125 [Trichinella sp. T8]|nr:hypothetical protein T08_2125 [Trichinella sp. T8]